MAKNKGNMKIEFKIFLNLNKPNVTETNDEFQMCIIIWFKLIVSSFLSVKYSPDR